jgi:hypothetical protein
VPEGDVAEHLDHVRRTQMPLEHLAAGQRATESWYPLVALRDVVDGVQDRLAGQRLHRYRWVGPRREMLTTTWSPAAAAPAGVAARICGPSSSIPSLRFCGPRELLSTTS